MQRMAMVIHLKPEKKAEYLRLHAQPWPEILAQISACNIRNYSIFLKEPEDILFGYWEYHGTDFEADMARKLGMHICSMGERILRCETAPVVALTALMYGTGNL